MREVVLSSIVEEKILELRIYLSEQLKLSETAANRRVDRIIKEIIALGNPVDYAECRFIKWRELGWRCVVVEGDWVFAYESFGNDGVIVMDMANASSLSK